VFDNNIVDHNHYGVKGSREATGTPTLERYFPGNRFVRNALVGGRASNYPSANFFPATYDEIRFVDPAGGDYHLASDSPLAGRGEGGADVGANIDALEAAISGP
jgi:hypothetical protein